jgi:hypothetical protein
MKRGAFNFIGELSKILFDAMDEDDPKKYNEQQLNAMKSSLDALNNTLMAVEFNEKK